MWEKTAAEEVDQKVLNVSWGLLARHTTYTTGAVACPRIPVLGRWRQEHLKFRLILCCRVGVRPVWAA